jgi:hypothetical protein
MIMAIVEVVGRTWFIRLARLLHAIPYLIGAWFLGYGLGWFWDLSPTIVAHIEAGGVGFLMCCTWLREWWRGY